MVASESRRNYGRLAAAPRNKTHDQAGFAMYRFGAFQVEPRTHELRRSGVRIKIQEQSFVVLLKLLEHPGELVTREQLRTALWPADTFVDFDTGLNTVIKRLREALRDSAEESLFIETVPKLGYRFIVPVEVDGQPPADTRPKESPPVFVRPSPSFLTRNFRVLAWAFTAVLVLVAAGLFWSSRSQPPRITGYTQITHDGRAKGFGGLVAGGERLYIQEIELDRFVISEVSISGGEAAILPTSLRDLSIDDISPGGSSLLLVGASDGAAVEGPLWTLPLPAGSPHRLGDLFVNSATWSPITSDLVFSKSQEIFIANGDGGNARKLTTVGGLAEQLRFSPDGQRLRFTLVDVKGGSSSLWELNRDGSGLHPLLPGWNESPQECCGNWTRDGRYFLFQSFSAGRKNIWVLPERGHWPGGRAEPAQLTNGPLDFTLPMPSRDGKRIFSVGVQPRAELVRYDAKTGFVPYFGSVSAVGLAFSPDGQWVAYTSVPDFSLWRSRVDGSERLQLTNASMRASLPRWSPDGQQIVFMGRTISTNWRAYLMSPSGGTPRDLIPWADAGFDPTWSPDGASIVLSLHNAGVSLHDQAHASR